MFLMMLVWLFVVGAVVWLVWRALRGRSVTGECRDRATAEELLKRRYAEGEIERSTYERMLDDLRSGPAVR